jgi:hypothetical protein
MLLKKGQLQNEVLIIVLVIVGTLTVFSFTLLYPSVIFVEFLVGYVAGALGILLGFGIQGLIDLDKDKKTMTDFLTLIHEELLETKVKLALNTEKIEALYTDVWDSAISSGAVRLFNAEQVTKISKTYKAIKNYSFEAELIRNGFEKLKDSPINENKYESFKNNSKTIDLNNEARRIKKILNRQIEELLKESWWNTKNSSGK